METISAAVDFLTGTPVIRQWPELGQFFHEMAARPSPHWRIPGVVCRAVGGSQEDAIPAVAAVMALHSSIVVVDDLLDGDGRFQAIGWNPEDLANLAQAIAAAGLDAIWRGPADDAVKRQAIQGLNGMLLRTAAGQFLDKHGLIQNESDYWHLVQAKSAPFFEAAFWSGAVLGGAPSQSVAALGKVGFLYGEMVQIHDDLKDALSTPASADWRREQASLPILFARSVNYPQRDEFLQLQQNLSDPDALKRAQTILVQSGGVSYCVKKLLERGSTAHQWVQETALVYPEPVYELINEITRPAADLFRNLGISIPVF